MRGRLAIGIALTAVIVGSCTPETSLTPSRSVTPVASEPGSIGANWLTYQRDRTRSGFDPSSPPLGRVRRSWTSPALDGVVYAEPLLFDARVFVATENDSVYALDAATGAVVWRTHLGDPVPRSALPCGNIDPTGITGTPVIDPSSGLLYAVAFLQPGRHELVAVDTANGRVRFHRSIDPPGANPLIEQQRAALAISHGRVYAAFGGLFGDCGDYHGLAVGLALDGRGPLLSYRVPSGRAAGIWAPSGPAVDASGDLLVATGNSFSSSAFDFGNAVIRLSPDLAPIGWFAPANWLALNQGDVDLGSVGPTLLPDRLAFQVGKEGIGYLLDVQHLGHIGGEAFSAPVCASGGGAFGGTAERPPFVYVPCTNGLVAVKTGPGPSFRVAWRGPSFHAGPPILAGGAVWVVDIGSGDLIALDSGTGARMFQAHLGEVTDFAIPAAGDGLLCVATLNRVVAFSGV
jgi:outer membrane protein assembly factor BamB